MGAFTAGVIAGSVAAFASGAAGGLLPSEAPPGVPGLGAPVPPGAGLGAAAPPGVGRPAPPVGGAAVVMRPPPDGEPTVGGFPPVCPHTPPEQIPTSVIASAVATARLWWRGRLRFITGETPGFPNAPRSIH